MFIYSLLLSKEPSKNRLPFFSERRFGFVAMGLYLLSRLGKSKPSLLIPEEEKKEYKKNHRLLHIFILVKDSPSVNPLL